MTPAYTFFPAPSELAPVICADPVCRPRGAWLNLKDDIAEQFGCDISDLSVEDFAWADGERVAEFVLLDGRIVGAIDDKLSADDWSDVLAVHAGEIEPVMSFTVAAE